MSEPFSTKMEFCKIGPRSMIVVLPAEESDVKKLSKNLETFDVGKINDVLDQASRLDRFAK
jgi:hypothetical protein